jgi:hypothetical protein
MEKKPRKKKALNIKLDTKNADLEIIRDNDGNIEVKLDTPVVDANYSKDAKGNIEFSVEIDDIKEYEFISNGTSPQLPEGTLWRVTGAMAKIFLQRKFGKLK